MYSGFTAAAENINLLNLTYTFNFFALIFSFWLGTYLITRHPRTPTAWLTALTVWSLGGLFLNVLLALNPPPVPEYRPSWLRFLFPFWASGTYEQGASAWLQGWSVAPAIVFWHHATLLMRPGSLNLWRKARIAMGYLTGLAAIEVQAFTQILFAVEGGDPLYLNSLQSGPLYSIFGIALIILTATSAVNLARSARVAPNETARRQLELLTVATVVAGLAGPLSLIASGLDLFPVPEVAMSFVLAVSVGMIGFGVARYSALVEGRTIRRDFTYNLTLITGITLFYLLAAWLLVLSYGVPRVVTLLIPILVIFTHSGMTLAPRLLDHLFYPHETRRLRSNLRSLSRLTGEGELLKENLNATLNALCVSVRARYGLIFACDGGRASSIAEFKWHGIPIEIPAQSLSADDATHVESSRFQPPLNDAALLVPLYFEAEQVGALLLGQPVNGLRYADDDVARVLHPADHIASVLYVERRKSQYLSRLMEVAEEHREHGRVELPSIPVECVESALRNLYDFAYLADTPLASLELVKKQLAGKKTHLERGKSVQAVLLEALDEMRPSQEVPPRDPPPREWYPYLILRDAYLEGVSNRDIMLKLYISEGTFNRTRRAAVRSLARALTEMEHPR
ncbi:MAG: hypothetical protein FJZ87_01350 [Chloroflexi bacterium]|nr:hypothetical protein [Chloroflexota bacterium]